MSFLITLRWDLAQYVSEDKYMRRFKAKYVLLGLVVAAAVLIALSGQFGYFGSWIAFGVLVVVVGMFAAAQSGLRLNDWFQVQREKNSAYEILGIHGLRPQSTKGAELKEGMRRALVHGKAAHESPIACACVREEDDGFVGIVRMGLPGSHACHEVSGPTQEAAAEKLTRWVNEHETDWVQSKDAVTETAVCNHRVCPLTSPTKAFAETTRAIA